MSKLVINGQEFEAADNIKVLDAYHKNPKMPITFGCKDGACGACLCKVVEGKENLENPRNSEKDFLNTLGFDHEDGYRLMCQSKIKSGKIIITDEIE